MKDIQLKIEYVPIRDIKPYEWNAKKHPQYQINEIAESIKQLGMNDPIGIRGNTIVEGHGRYVACKQLGYQEIPVIRLDHMNEEQMRAYILIHNKLTMNTGFNMDKVNKELKQIFTIDMSAFEFEMPGLEEEDDEGYFGDAREMTYDKYNLHEYDAEEVEGFYQMPIIKPCDYVPDDLIGFNYVLTTNRRDAGIHFYIDDYQFERIWQRPTYYIEKLGKFQCVLTPDFSLYMDMPMAMKIWNIYRSRLIGQLCQKAGMNVIPTVSWAERDTFSFCYDGLPKESTVSVSTVGVKQSTDGMRAWKAGMDEMIRRLNPKRILVYGGEVEYEYGDVEVIYYDNHVTERMKGA